MNEREMILRILQRIDQDIWYDECNGKGFILEFASKEYDNSILIRFDKKGKIISIS